MQEKKTVQMGFKTSAEIAAVINDERTRDGVSLAEFIRTAISYYIDHRVEQRIAVWQMTTQKEKEK